MARKSRPDPPKPPPPPDLAAIQNLEARARNGLIAEGFDTPGAHNMANEFAEAEARRQGEIATETWREMARDLSVHELWFFVTEILWPKSWQEHYTEDLHRPLCNMLDDAEYGSDTWWFLPRGHRKSYLMTVARILQSIVADPNIRVLLGGAREETVVPFAELILSAFLPETPGFEMFQYVFPDFVIDKRTRGRRLRTLTFTHPLRQKTLTDPTFRATYLGVTGAGWRCDEFHADDMVERRNVTTPDMSIATLKKYLDFTPLVDKTGSRAMIFGSGTRWAYHDPYGRILGDETDLDPAHRELTERIRNRPNMRIAVRHALEHPSQLCTVCPAHVVEKYPHGNPDIKDGLPIADPVWTKAMILDELDRYLVDPDMGESMWWHQYMNVCVSPTSRKFREEWFLQGDRVSWIIPRRPTLVIDAADKDFQKVGTGDYMVALMADYDDSGRTCVRFGLRSNRWTRQEFINRILAYCQTVDWWPIFVGKEKFGNDTFLTEMVGRLRELGHPCVAKPITRPMDIQRKQDYQIASLQNAMQAGNVVFGCNCPVEIIARARYELVNVGQTRNDDVADTLALLRDPEIAPSSRDKLDNPRAGAWKSMSMSSYGVPPAPASRERFSGLAPKKDPVEALLETPSYMDLLQGVSDQKPVSSGRSKPIRIPTPGWLKGV